jgi:hypothetical protein
VLTSFVGTCLGAEVNNKSRAWVDQSYLFKLSFNVEHKFYSINFQILLYNCNVAAE